jgi:hypothetical protein
MPGVVRSSPAARRSLRILSPGGAARHLAERAAAGVGRKSY